MNDGIADTTITIGADFSGAEREAAKFQKSVEAASVATSNTFRLVTRNSEKTRASLAKVNAETELLKRRAQAIVDRDTLRDFDSKRRSLGGRLVAGGTGFFTGLSGFQLGPQVGTATAIAGGAVGLLNPEIEDALQLSRQAEVKALLSAVSDLEGTLEVGREVLAETASQLSLAFGSSPLLDDVDTRVLSARLQSTGVTVGRYDEQLTKNLLRLKEIFESLEPAVQKEITEEFARRFPEGLPESVNETLRPSKPVIIPPPLVITEEDERRQRGHRAPVSIPISPTPGAVHLLPPDLPFGGQRVGGSAVAPGLAFLVGERGPEIFVPDRAGRILPNSFLSSAGGLGGNLGGGFAELTGEVERLGMAIEATLGELPEEFGFIAESIEGPLNEALSGNIRSWEDLREAALGAAQEVLGGILQSEEVRAEIGELADVIDNVLNQALSGSIDSWEDLGRVALEVLEQILQKILETQQASAGGLGGGGLSCGSVSPSTSIRMPSTFGSNTAAAGLLTRRSKILGNNDAHEDDRIGDISRSTPLRVVTAARAVKRTRADLPAANRAG